MVVVSRKITTINLEEDHVDWMDSQGLNRSEFINTLIQRHRSGEGQIEDAVRQHRIQQLRSEIESNRAQVESKESELEHLLSAQERASAREDEYETRVESIGDEFAESHRVFPTFRPDASEVADEFGKQLAEVANDIREYVEENYDIDDSRWTDSYGDGMA